MLLALYWCMYLLANWSMALSFHGPVGAVRPMIFAGLIGLTLLWPAWRLSLGAWVWPMPSSSPPGASGSAQASALGAAAPGQEKWPILFSVLRDWLSLNLVFQAVIWALMLTADWHVRQTGWLSGAVAAWSLLTGAVIAWGCLARRGGQRTGAMVACVLLLVGEPLVRLIVGLFNPSPAVLGAPMRLSPIGVLWWLTVRPADFQLEPAGLEVIAIAIVAVMAWVGLGLFARARQE